MNPFLRKVMVAVGIWCWFLVTKMTIAVGKTGDWTTDYGLKVSTPKQFDRTMMKEPQFCTVTGGEIAIWSFISNSSTLGRSYARLQFENECTDCIILSPEGWAQPWSKGNGLGTKNWAKYGNAMQEFQFQVMAWEPIGWRNFFFRTIGWRNWWEHVWLCRF